MNPFTWLKWMLWRWGLTFMYKLYCYLEPTETGSYRDQYYDIFYEQLLQEEFQ